MRDCRQSMSDQMYRFPCEAAVPMPASKAAKHTSDVTIRTAFPMN
jgi:hypothetical protein